MGFAEYEVVKMDVCPLNLQWSCYTFESFEVNICDNVVSMDGHECPSAGNYTFEFVYTLPSDNGKQWFWGWSFKFVARFYSSQQTSICSIDVKRTQSRYQMLWSLAGVAGLVSVLSFVVIKGRNVECRRRIGAKPAPDEPEFYRMNEPTGDENVLVI